MSMKSDTATRYVGFCAVCEGKQKLKEGKLVHHGYQRPGDGSIHGDCYAVGREPHETSPKVAEEWRAGQAAKAVNLRAYLAKLEAGEVNEIVSVSFSGIVTHYTPTRRVTKHIETKVEEVEEGPLAAYAWKHALEREIRVTNAHITGADSEVARMDGLLKDWAPKPLITFEESKEELKRAREAAKGVRQAARKARVDAKLESYRKRIDSAYKKVAKGGKSTLADIFDSSRYAYSSLGYRTHADLLVAIDRQAVWAELGLTTASTAEEREVQREQIQKLRFG